MAIYLEKKKFGIEFPNDKQARENFKKIYEEFICIKNEKNKGKELNHKEFRIFCHLLRSTNKGKKPSNRSLEKIGEICGMNKDTAGKWIKELQNKGYISIEVDRVNSDKNTNNFSHQIHTRNVNESLSGINSLNQLYIDQVLDDYGFTPAEFRVYFHMIFKYEFPNFEKKKKNIAIPSISENTSALPRVEINVTQDSKELQNIGEKTLQKTLHSLEQKQIIIAEPQKYACGTNQAINYQIRGISDSHIAKAIKEDKASSGLEKVEEQRPPEPNLDDIPF